MPKAIGLPEDWMVIKLECDNCERSFEVDPSEAGGKVKCPHCGDVNRVPAAAPPPQAGVTGTGPDDLPTGSGPEQEIRVLHPAMLRAHPFRFLAIALLLIGGVVLAIWAGASEAVSRLIVWPGVLMALAGAGWWLTWYLGAHLWVKLQISNKRTIRSEGIIRRHTSEVLHDHVRNVEIRQNFLQRITNVGYLGISSAGQDDIEIEIKDIPKPYELKALIDRYREL